MKRESIEMARSLNQATIIGNVGRDPEIRSTQSGKRIASFSIATNETWRDRNSGERKQETEWHNIVVWQENAVEFCEKWLRKGDLCLVQGKIKNRKWTDKDNRDRYTTEIVVDQFNGTVTSMEKAEGGGGGGDRQGADGGYSGGSGNYQGGTGNLRDRAGENYGGGQQRQRSGVGSDLDDEIPF